MVNDSKPSEKQKEAANRLFENKFGKKIESIAAKDHSLQNDARSCGVFCCFCAYQLASGFKIIIIYSFVNT